MRRRLYYIECKRSFMRNVYGTIVWSFNRTMCDLPKRNYITNDHMAISVLEWVVLCSVLFRLAKSLAWEKFECYV